MKIVVFGLSISSAWGNGHATLLRGLFRELWARGHETVFFERDVPYYAAHRDVTELPFVNLRFYNDWQAQELTFRAALADADVAMITSYCPDAIKAGELIRAEPQVRSVFYDMDTPVTLHKLSTGEAVPYLPPEGLASFDLVLSYTGGKALVELSTRLGAKCVAPLYGWVDPEVHFRTDSQPDFCVDLSYLGTYAEDRQDMLEAFLLEPARRSPDRKFLVAGAMYPETAAMWPANVRLLDHVAPPRHPAFYSSSNLTLSVTRRAMAEMGYCPSGRLFEAAACGTAVLSDCWEGLDEFFQAGSEILIARTTGEAFEAIRLDSGMLLEIGSRAKERTLDCHTAGVRADRFLQLLDCPATDCRQDPVAFASSES